MGSVYLTQTDDYSNLWTIINHEDDCFYKFEISITNGGQGGYEPFSCIPRNTCQKDGYNTTFVGQEGDNKIFTFSDRDLQVTYGVQVYGNTQFAAYASEFRGVTKTDVPKNLVAGAVSTVEIRKGYSLTVKYIEKKCSSIFDSTNEPQGICLDDEPTVRQ